MERKMLETKIRPEVGRTYTCGEFIQLCKITLINLPTDRTETCNACFVFIYVFHTSFILTNFFRVSS